MNVYSIFFGNPTCILHVPNLYIVRYTLMCFSPTPCFTSSLFSVQYISFSIHSQSQKLFPFQKSDRPTIMASRIKET